MQGLPLQQRHGRVRDAAVLADAVDRDDALARGRGRLGSRARILFAQRSILFTILFTILFRAPGEVKRRIRAGERAFPRTPTPPPRPEYRGEGRRNRITPTWYEMASSTPERGQLAPRSAPTLPEQRRGPSRRNPRRAVAALIRPANTLSALLTLVNIPPPLR